MDLKRKTIEPLEDYWLSNMECKLYFAMFYSIIFFYLVIGVVYIWLIHPLIKPFLHERKKEKAVTQSSNESLVVGN